MDLPENDFLAISSKTPLINVDLFVVNEDGELLLSWRDDEFCGTGWHIPGGIIRHGETMRERLEITAKDELGYIPAFDDSPPKITEIFLNLEYRNHFISLMYECHCKKTDVDAGFEEKVHCVGDLCWFNYNPGLVYSQASYEEYLNIYFYTLSDKKNVGKPGV